MHTPDEIAVLRAEARAMRARAGNVRYKEVEALLDKIRVRRAGGRDPFAWTFPRPGAFPLTVPRHPKPIKAGTLRHILGAIDADLDYMEAVEQ